MTPFCHRSREIRAVERSRRPSHVGKRERRADHDRPLTRPASPPAARPAAAPERARSGEPVRPAARPAPPGRPRATWRRSARARSCSPAPARRWRKVGRCRTFFNGVEKPSATLVPGETVMLRDELVLLCVLRPRMLPELRGVSKLQPFGEADAHGIVGESPEAWELRDQLALAARTNDHVLLRGESGTAKELAAAVIVEQSPRAAGPRVSHNASSFSPALVTSELFGNPADYPNPGTPARKGPGRRGRSRDALLRRDRRLPQGGPGGALAGDGARGVPRRRGGDRAAGGRAVLRPARPVVTGRAIQG